MGLRVSPLSAPLLRSNSFAFPGSFPEVAREFVAPANHVTGSLHFPRCVWSDRIGPKGDFIHKPKPGGPRRCPGGPVRAQKPHPVPQQPAHPLSPGRSR